MSKAKKAADTYEQQVSQLVDEHEKDVCVSLFARLRWKWRAEHDEGSREKILAGHDEKEKRLKDEIDGILKVLKALLTEQMVRACVCVPVSARG